MTLLEVKGLRVELGGKRVLSEVDFHVAEGCLVGILGPNGAGKSTLLRACLGLVDASAGSVHLANAPIGSMDRRELALRVAYVPQLCERTFEYTVRDVVAMGRLPHQGRFRPEGPEDQRAIDEAFTHTDLSGLATRPVTTLSGGEWQRVLLARAFAQRSPVLLLDEPTASLDLRHAHRTLTLLREGIARAGGAALAIHDLNLAAQYCDRLLLLKDGAVVADGDPTEVLTPAHLSQAFDVSVEVRREKDGAIVVRSLGGR